MRAVVYESMDIEDYYYQAVESDKLFEDLSHKEYTKLESQREARNREVAEVILERANILNLNCKPKSATHLLDAVREIEDLYNGYDRDALKYFQSIGKYILSEKGVDSQMYKKWNV